jgi:hypothetical protein
MTTSCQHIRRVWTARMLALGVQAIFTGCGGDHSASPAPASQRVTLTGVGLGGVMHPFTWAAFQDGDGPWQRLESDAGAYAFDSASGRYTLAYVCAPLVSAEIIAATVAEMPAVTARCSEAVESWTRYNWRGTLQGGAARDETMVVLGSMDGTVSADIALDGGNYTAEVTAGTYDIAVLAGDPARLAVARDVAIAASGSTDIDVAAASIVAKPHPLALPTNLAPGEQIAYVAVGFTSKRGATLPLPSSGIDSVQAFDAQDLVDGDHQDLSLYAMSLDQSGERGFIRGVDGAALDALPALALPDAFTATVTAAGRSPVLRPRVSFEPYPGVLFYQMNTYSIGAAPAGLGWLMNVGADWLGARGSFELPDLSGVPGYDPKWGPGATIATTIETTAITSTRGFGATLDGEPGGIGTVAAFAKKITVLQP